MRVRAFTLIAGAAVLSACGGDSGGSDAGDTTGDVSFQLTDAPSDELTQVQLTITAIGLKPANGPEEKITLDQPLVISNLLELQGSNAASIIPPTEVTAGRYNWVRLYVLSGDENTYVTHEANGEFPLYVPGQQNNNEQERHVQLVSGFNVPAGGQADFTIDVDLRRAITKPATQPYYLIRPAMRIIDNAKIGTISGTVADALVTADNCSSDSNSGAGNTAYLFTGLDATPGDIYVDDQGTALTEDNPLSTASVTQQNGGGYGYEFGFVAPGDYTVAFTCQGLDDAPDNDDAIVFSAQANVSVVADSTAEADLQ